MKIVRKYGEVHLDKISGYWCLSYIYVKPEYRDKGFAKTLMADVLEKCKNRPIYLFVSAEFGSNYNRLCKFYKQFGFIKEKQLRDSVVPFNYNMILWE